MESISADQIVGISNEIFLPLIYLLGSVLVVCFIFPQLGKQIKLILKKWSTQLKINVPNFLFYALCVLIAIYSMSRVFTFLGGILPGYVEIDQSSLFYKINTTYSKNGTLAKLWAYYPECDSIDEFTNSVIHDVSLYSYNMPGSYYSQKYYMLRDSIAYGIGISTMFRVFILICIICIVFRSIIMVQIMYYNIKYWIKNNPVKLRVQKKLRISGKNLAIIIFVSVAMNSVFTYGLIEDICSQSLHRCNFALTYLNADDSRALDAKGIEKYAQRIRELADELEIKKSIYVYPPIILNPLKTNWGGNHFPRAAYMYNQQMIWEYVEGDD